MDYLNYIREKQSDFTRQTVGKRVAEDIDGYIDGWNSCLEMLQRIEEGKENGKHQET
jgi:hypothetical protein